MKRIYIGIDLSTKLIGWAIILKNEGKITSHLTKETQLPDWPVEIAGLKYYQLAVKEMVEKISNALGECSYSLDPIEISMELSNFSNPRLTQRFSKVAGIVETLFLQTNYAKAIESIKYFNANEWFKHFAKDLGITNFTELSREERKELSVNEYIKRYKIKKSDNETDAFWITYYSEMCNTTEITEEKNREIKNVKKAIQLAKFSIRQYENNMPFEKEAQKKFLVKIDKYKKRLETLENKLKELKHD